MYKQTFESKFEVIEKLDGKFCDLLKISNRNTGKNFIAKRFRKPCKNLQSLLECPDVVLLQKLPFHPNIFGLVEYFFETFGDRVTFLYDIVDANLREVIRESAVGLKERVSRVYLRQMLHGLEHLHKNGFFHRNINPETILVKNYSGTATEDQIVKLGGLESVRGIYSSPPYTDCVNVNRYRAPEALIAKGFYGSKIDVWALGCIFYEMMKGKQLFKGHTDIDQMEKIRNVLGNPRCILTSKLRQHMEPLMKTQSNSCLDHLLVDVSPKGRKLLRSMLEYEPDLRPNASRLLKNSYFMENPDKYEGRCSVGKWTQKMAASFS